MVLKPQNENSVRLQRKALLEYSHRLDHKTAGLIRERRAVGHVLSNQHEKWLRRPTLQRKFAVGIEKMKRARPPSLATTPELGL
jgi:hypothetical protein